MAAAARVTGILIESTNEALGYWLTRREVAISRCVLRDPARPDLRQADDTGRFAAAIAAAEKKKKPGDVSTVISIDRDEADALKATRGWSVSEPLRLTT